MQPQANAVSYGTLYICRSLSATASLAFRNPSSFCGEAQEDSREHNYYCNKNLVQPLCLTMVSEDRFISPRLNRWEERTHVRSRVHPGIVRTHTEQWPPSLFSPGQTDSSFSESRDSVNGESNKKSISCTIVFVKRFTQLLYCNFVFIKLFFLNVNTRRFQHSLISILINYFRNLK